MVNWLIFHLSAGVSGLWLCSVSNIISHLADKHYDVDLKSQSAIAAEYAGLHSNSYRMPTSATDLRIRPSP